MENNMIKIGACVVLYNPDKDVIENINTYLIFLEKVVVVDNSTEESEVINEIKKLNKVHYISMNGNKGIAEALNVGIRYLSGENFKIALTMDQDSKFPTENHKEIINIVNKLSSQYSIIGLNTNYFPEIKTGKITEVPFIITSGNFISIEDFNFVGGFLSDLFIDYVDFEYNYRLILNNKKICLLNDYSLIHTVGNPIKINFFGHKTSTMNHPPIRYYYRYRNCIFLFMKYKKPFRHFLISEFFINIPKMILFEPYKLKKTKMIFRGIKDGYLKKLGAYVK